MIKLRTLRKEHYPGFSDEPNVIARILLREKREGGDGTEEVEEAKAM